MFFVFFPEEGQVEVPEKNTSRTFKRTINICNGSFMSSAALCLRETAQAVNVMGSGLNSRSGTEATEAVYREENRAGESEGNQEGGDWEALRGEEAKKSKECGDDCRECGVSGRAASWGELQGMGYSCADWLSQHRWRRWGHGKVLTGTNCSEYLCSKRLNVKKATFFIFSLGFFYFDSNVF